MKSQHKGLSQCLQAVSAQEILADPVIVTVVSELAEYPGRLGRTHTRPD